MAQKMFWNNMTAEKTKPSSELKAAIEETFGSFDAFKEKFNKAAASRFGSGWAWLVINSDGKLANKFFPFCSERCKMIDMGQWFDEEYRIEKKAEDEQAD